MSTPPETRFTMTIARSLTACRTAQTPVDSASHQASDPSATPRVTTSALPVPACVTSPAPAKIAAKAMIVIGLVSVRPTALV